MVVAELIAGAAQAGVAVLFLTGHADLGPLMSLSAVNGAAAAMFLPAAAGVVPQIVASEQLQPANALLRISMNLSGIVGAALAGVLVAGLGSGTALAIDAGTFVASAALLVGLAIPHVTRVERNSTLTDLRVGWQEFASRQWVWVIVAVASIVNAATSAVLRVLGPAIAQVRYHGALGWSAILTVQAVGLLSGSVAAIRVKPKHPLRTAMIAVFGFLPPIVLLGIGAPLITIALTFFVAGVCSDIFEVLWSTALQQHIPDDALSRVSSYDAFGSFVMGPLGLAVAGPLAAAFGTRSIVLSCAALVFAATATGLTSPAVRNLR
ncbi:MAG: transporter [Frankiales bacterium]|nr:transporter [Frankiales bacterium]